MQAQATSAAVCPECGTRLEEGFSRGLGRCMICLLRVGFDDAEEPDETLFALVADRLGNYRIERRDDGTLWELGRGAMGVTYRAVDTSLQRPVALKLIDSEWVKRGAEARERFMREARTAASLRHPNVATVYHFGMREENGQCFCAMELLEGETLEMRIRRTGPLDALTTIDIALQVSSALAAAEKQGLVHRDLKPANLMFVAAAPDANDSSPGKAEQADTVVKVIDFGVAKALVEKPDAMGLTHGGFIGTPAFASPEQFTNAPVGVRSDIYSLGATLWYLLTGHRPFEGATIEQIRANQHSQALPIEQLKAAHVPSRLVSLLVSMLATEPAARPDVRAFTSQLQDCRTQILDRWQAPRRLPPAAGLIRMAAAVFALFPRWHNRAMSQNTAPANISERSIAVLPFENLSDDRNDAFFADGIRDDVLTRLAQVRELKVISRSAVRQYPATVQRNLREIGLQLGVVHVLEGSVRRSGDRVLVNVSLVEARNERQLWAQHYERTLADSIALQGEIATEIATALRVRLSLEEQTQLTAKPTHNPEAYLLYLQAEKRGCRGAATFKGLDRTRIVENLYSEAVALDPDFALARAQLSATLAFRYHDFEPNDAVKTRARAEAEEALRLQPNLGEAYVARALCLYWMENNYEAALRELETAARLLPNAVEVEEFSGFIRRRQGRWREARAGLERARALDPRDSIILGLFATDYFLRDWTAAKKTSEAALAVATGPPTLLRIEKAYLKLWSANDLGPLLEAVAAAPAGYDPDGAVTLARWDAALLARDFGKAERAVNDCTRERILTGHGTPVPRSYFVGCVAVARGEPERARGVLDEARVIMEAEVANTSQEPFRHAQLGLLYAFLRRKEDALRAGRRAVELWPIEKDAIYGAQMLGLLAVIYAWTGERDQALDLVERLLVTPAAVLPAFEGSITLAELRLRWQWDPLRTDPRFQKILEAPEPKTSYR
jgi:serine/threonine protein kinase/tetratricopeptide (TPR) repeat protein